MMKARTGLDIILVLTLLFAPWWLFAVILTLAALYNVSQFSEFPEFFIFALVYDLLYFATAVGGVLSGGGTGGVRVLGVSPFFTIGAFALYGILAVLRSQTSLFSR